MATYHLLREDELAVVAESAYGTSAGDPVGGDMFKHTSSSVEIQHITEEAARDTDRENGVASVITLQTGRQRASVVVSTDVVPSGVTGTPTAPDVHELIKAAIGSSRTASAHSTLTSSSTTTLLKLTAGGVAAMGIAVGDMIAVDVSAAFGLQVRQVTAIATDDVTVDRALSAAPASGRAVYGGTTYRLSEAALLSVHLWLFNETLKYKMPGTIFNEFDFSLAYSENVPKGKFRFSGMGIKEETHSVSRPTPTTAGYPLVPSEGKIWLGTSLIPIINAGFNIKNGLELRQNESTSLFPTAVKRTGNNSRYAVELSSDMYLTTDTKTYYDAAKSRTAIDALFQHGSSLGSIFAYRAPAWKPNGTRTEQDGELGLRLAGRGFGVSGDDEITAFFG